jgi:hypothetical protein
MAFSGSANFTKWRVVQRTERSLFVTEPGEQVAEPGEGHADFLEAVVEQRGGE